MKILQVHNEYAFPGGEDSAAVCEVAMLRRAGHEVVTYHKNNADIETGSWLDKLKFLAGDFFYSKRVYDELTGILRAEAPDLVHFHNPFYMMTTAAYEACFNQGVPVVQTVHNYRFLCVAATLSRDGEVCEQCLDRGRVCGIWHRCWKGSFWSSMLLTRLIEEYERKNILRRVSRFICLSGFSYNKFLQAGWPKDRMCIRPNSSGASVPSVGEKREKFVLYVGALQLYKGVTTMLDAWREHLGGVSLKIIGSGPLESYVRQHASGNIEFLGQKLQGEVIEYMRKASCLLLPSHVYENCPMVIIEAYACGLPVVASRLGALAEMVHEDETGLLFEPGNIADLAAKVKMMVSSPERVSRCSVGAVKCFCEKYGVDKGYQQLVGIYSEVVKHNV